MQENSREPRPEAAETELADENRPRLSRRLRPQRGVLIIALIVVAAAIWLLWWYYSGRESTDDAQVDGHISPISARVGGTVLDVKIEDNQIVKAGEVLVVIDPR